MIHAPIRRRSFGIVLFAVTLVGCAQSTSVRVVDLDNASKPIANATVSRFPTPHHRGDAFSTTPTEVQRTDADGMAVIGANDGRLVVSAPDKASAAVYSTFLPHSVEIGVSAAPPAAAK